MFFSDINGRRPGILYPLKALSRKLGVKQRWPQGGRYLRHGCQRHRRLGCRHRHTGAGQRHGRCPSKKYQLICSFLYCPFVIWGAMICRLTTTAWTLREFPFARITFSLGMSAVSLEEPESDQLSWAILGEHPTQIFVCNPIRPMTYFYKISIGNILHLLFGHYTIIYRDRNSAMQV